MRIDHWPSARAWYTGKLVAIRTTPTRRRGPDRPRVIQNADPTASAAFRMAQTTLPTCSEGPANGAIRTAANGGLMNGM